jgi:hypothetical protein
VDISDWLLHLATSTNYVKGSLSIINRYDSTAFVDFDLIDISDTGTYYELTVDYAISSGTFANSAPIVVSFSRAGDSGYSGYSGGLGQSGYSGYSGTSGYSGRSGYSAYSGVSGYSGYSGRSGYSGYSGLGFNYAGTWDSVISYKINDVVTYNGSSYVSLLDLNLNKQPDTSPSYWGPLAVSGYSAYSGKSGYSAYSGTSGYSG